MAGNLSVRSELGRGSTFTLSIPLDRAQPVPAVVETRPPVTKLSVLLVDDDPVNRDVGHALLVRLGHEPVVASSGAMALELVRSGAFDVVLMDVHMPEMDGIATARLIRKLQLDRSPRIIALTADLSDRTQGRLTANGIRARVGKPITLQALQSALQAGVDDLPGAPVGASELTAGSLIDDDFFNDQEELLGVPRLRGLRTIFLDTCLPLTRSMVEAASMGIGITCNAWRIGSAVRPVRSVSNVCSSNATGSRLMRRDCRQMRLKLLPSSWRQPAVNLSLRSMNGCESPNRPSALIRA